MFESKALAADHKDLIHDITFDFYGRRMATCSSDQSVKVGNHRECFKRNLNILTKYPAPVVIAMHSLFIAF